MPHNKFIYSIIFLATLLSCQKDDVSGEPQDEPQDEGAECAAWVAFDSSSQENVLIDYSYAGYRRGESGVADVATMSLDTFDITDYGAIADDGVSDRAAIVAAAAALKSNGGGILYIPEGTFDLHTEDDVSESTIITTGNIVLKGAGRDLSILRMSAPMQPADENILYSSPVALYIKHNSDGVKIADVAADSSKGSFSLWLESTAEVSAGDWICLKLADNSAELVEARLGSEYYSCIGASYDISTNGIQVIEYHQIKEVVGNRVVLYEPLLHEVESRWSWAVYSYPHYEEVGVEDLTFEGDAKDDFSHHESWEDDGAYKPINLMRLTNSWMRRVTFRNVSEASSIVSCANVSVYDVIIEGNRGHSAIRSQSSTRVFIGKISDFTSGGEGQFHAVGVSKPAIGTVLWRNEWGTDGCFESHANQPRATLIDNCRGAFMEYHQGGDVANSPSHMEDLTMWNFEATSTSGTSPFRWWNTYDGWRFLPPIVVGFHGAEITFDTSQMRYEESTSKAVYPESLYEAQITKRLGALPSWVTDIKNVKH